MKDLKKGFVSSRACVCVRVCVRARLCWVSNHSDPRVAWPGQGAGIQWRGCPTVAASFRWQSKSGMEREVDIACKQVTVVVKADVGVCVLSGCISSESLGLISFSISFTQTVYDILSCRHAQCLFNQWLRRGLQPCVQGVWTLSASADPLPPGCSSSYNLNESICFSNSNKTCSAVDLWAWLESKCVRWLLQSMIKTNRLVLHYSLNIFIIVVVRQPLTEG